MLLCQTLLGCHKQNNIVNSCCADDCTAEIVTNKVMLVMNCLFNLVMDQKKSYNFTIISVVSE